MLQEPGPRRILEVRWRVLHFLLPYTYCTGIIKHLNRKWANARTGDTAQEKRPVLKKLEAAAPAIRSQCGVTRIGIFGSFARGEQTRTSDMDVLVDFASGYATLKNFIGLCDYLERLFRRKVDLLTVEEVDKYIRPAVESEVIWV